MADSQRSFETLLGRFQNGDAFIQSLTDYNPNNNLIKKASCTAFIAEVLLKDKAVTLTEKPLGDEVAARKPLVFREKGCDENCLENRIRNIHAYIGADISKKCAAYKHIGAMIKKFAPHYKKKDPNAPPAEHKTPSPSEQSFVAMNGYGIHVHQLIVELGADYTPQNPYIIPDAFKDFVDDLVERSKKISKFEADYSDATAARRPYYYGPEGILERERLIKDYLASFPGGKKSQNYIEYDRLIKGR
jgi:hypothetical protein